MARQGHPDAIATLINRHLQAKGITAYVAQQEDLLQVILEAAVVPHQAELVPYVSRGIKGLGLAHIHRLIISGKQQGHYGSDWTEEVTLGTGLAISTAGGEAATGPDSTTLTELEALLASQDTSAGAALTDSTLDLERELGLAFQDEGDLDLADLPSLDLDQALDLDLELAKATSQTDSLGLEAPIDLEASDRPDLNLDFLIDQDNLGFDSDLGADFDGITPAAADLSGSFPQGDQKQEDHWDLNSDAHPGAWNPVSEVSTPADFEKASAPAAEEFDPNLVFNSAPEPPMAEPHPFDLKTDGEDTPGLIWPEDAWDSGDQFSGTLPQPPMADLDWSLDSSERVVGNQFQPETLNLDPETFGTGHQSASAGPSLPSETDISIPGMDFSEELGFDPSPTSQPTMAADLGDRSLADLDSPSLDLGAPPPPEFGTPGDFNQDFYGANLTSAKGQSNGFWPESEVFNPTSGAADLEAADDFIHKFAPVSDQEVAQLNARSRSPGNLKSLPKILAGVGFGALALVLSWMGFNTLRTALQQSPGVTLAPAPTPMPIKPAPSPDLTQTDTFRQAVNTATRAATLSQTAKTAAEWQVIVNSWKQAIALMQQVPPNHPRHSLAQTKVGEYQSNLGYAVKNLNRLSQPQ